MSDQAIAFTHLCVHSFFTFLGGTASIDSLVERAKKDGLSHLALTDRNVLYGTVKFTHKCIENHIQPVIGMEISIAQPEELGFQYSPGYPGNVVLLAKDTGGYRSLCKISSMMHSTPEHEAIIDNGIPLDALRHHCSGLFCISGGRSGWMVRAIKNHNNPAAYRFAARLAILFGSDNVALALENHLPEDIKINQEIQSLANRLAIRSVVVQPVLCLNADEAARLKVLAAIRHNTTIDKIPASALPSENGSNIAQHWLDAVEMTRRYDMFPEALAESMHIARQCEFTLPYEKIYFPSVNLPEGKTADQQLAQLTDTGLSHHYGTPASPTILERLQKELDVISHYGFAPLFLVVADIVRFARQMEIPVSSRGSVANSLAAFCAGITNVDPIEHDLLFERFLSPARADIPDIDLDFCSRRRDEVLDYVRNTYGEERVALVGTINTMRLRSAVRETAKAFGLDETTISRLVKDLPRHYHHAFHIDDLQSSQDLMSKINDPYLLDVLRQAAMLVGLPHHLGVHPGGVIISPFPLTDMLPLQWASKGFLTTQYDHFDLEEIGFPKLDLLGVSALTVLSDAASLIRLHHNPNFNLETIPADDAKTAALLSRGDTVGVFQCESQGARSTLRKLKACSIRDLAIANAFFKPGPRLGGMAQTFVRRYRGEEKVHYLHPALEPILAISKGVLIFQEQVLRVAREVAGLNWQQAGQLRRGMSKMKAENMREIEKAFIQGCQVSSSEAAALSKEQAQQLWQQVSAFSGYGFNQGHATAYAAVSYKMAYLKTHFPAAYLCARLANFGGFHHPAVYMVEAIRLGFIIHPPHVNHSRHDFHLSLEGNNAHLWMGLGQIRDLRHSSIHRLVEERQLSPFKNLRDVLQRVSLQKKESIHLIQCGALDGMSDSRCALLAELEEINHSGSVLQLPLFANYSNLQHEGISETPLQQYHWEMQLLGYPVSTLHTPLALVRDRLPANIISLNQLSQQRRRKIITAGIRIPGWSGGDGFYLWDGESWVIARQASGIKNPKAWQALVGHGRWTCDEWDTCWLQLDELYELNPT